MKKVSVVIADDHAVVRDGLSALLEANPEITVLGDAADGLQAISQATRLRPDVVIMDISMPKLNGIDAAVRILELCPEANVIILSMLGAPEHVQRALRAGVRGYLLKESAGREVIDAVLAVHAGNVYLSAPVTNTVVAGYLQQPGPTPGKQLLERLSQREREILHLVVEGKTSAEIGELLSLSPKTVDSYRSRLMHKLGTPDLAALIRLAIEEGLVP